MRRSVLTAFLSAAALPLTLGACQMMPAAPRVVEAPPPATPAAPRLETVAGAWVAAKAANLRAGPGTDFPVVGGVRPGDRLDVLGRAPGTEWFAVRQGKASAFIHTRLVHQTDGPAPVTQRTVVAVPAPVPEFPPKVAPDPVAAPVVRAEATVPVAAPMAAPVAVQALVPTPMASAPTAPLAAPSAAMPVFTPVVTAQGRWVATGDPVPLRPSAR
jgi:uncharacterized protein YraI